MHLLNFQICRFLYGHGGQRMGTSKDLSSNVEIDSFFPHHPQTLQLLSLSPHLTQIFTFSPTSCPWRMRVHAEVSLTWHVAPWNQVYIVRASSLASNFYIFMQYAYIFNTFIYKHHILCLSGYILASQTGYQVSLLVLLLAKVNSW